MSGAKAGGKKTAETNKRLHGSDFYARIGAKGGKKSRRTGIKNGEGKCPRPKKTTHTTKKNTYARSKPKERVFKEYAVIEQPKKKGLFSKIFGRKNA